MKNAADISIYRGEEIRTALTLSRSHHGRAPFMGVCSGLRFYRHLVGNALETSRTKQNRRRANNRFKVTVG